MKASSRPTPRICDTVSGERSPPFVYRHYLIERFVCCSLYLFDETNPICAFSVDGGFPGCPVPSPCYSIDIPSECSFRGFYSLVEPASLVGLLIGNAFV